ncbi:MAG: hypothetical protein P8163_12070 [Candidatus Thiodiazotropha sp.]
MERSTDFLGLTIHRADTEGIGCRGHTLIEGLLEALKEKYRVIGLLS